MFSEPTSLIIGFAVLGLLVGSFLNVLIARFKALETVVATRSHCPSCKRQIPWYDLVPLLSFVLLWARCRYCREKISWQYPIIELLTAGLVVHLVLVFGLTWLTLGYFLVFALLLVIAAIDSRHYVIPDEFMLPAIAVAVAVSLAVFKTTPLAIIYGLLAGGGLLAFFVIISRERWMGMGDIGLGVVMGLLGGWPGVIAGLVTAFGLGSLVGMLGLAAGRKGLKDKIPFGPFLVVGSYVAALWGSELVEWYLTMVHYY